LHQQENVCNESSGLSTIAALVPFAALSNRSSIIQLLGLVEAGILLQCPAYQPAHLLLTARFNCGMHTAKVLQLRVADCSYCLLETVEHVGGSDFVTRHLKVLTDYPILPRACLPALADALAADQAEAVRAYVELRVPFGLSAPDADVADIFIPMERGSQEGAITAYRGLYTREYLYRCRQAPDERWAIAAEHDPTAWIRCEGRLWIELESASIFDEATTDRLGGVFFDLGIEPCGDELAKAVVEDSHAAEPQSGSASISFSADVSAVRVACSLLQRFGAFSPAWGQEGPRSVIVQLPGNLETIPMLGDIVVRAGEHLTLQAAPALSLAVGQWQLRVEAGGRLELLGVGLVGSVGSSAMIIEGEVAAANCTFSRGAADASVVMRYLEAQVPIGSAPPIRGAMLIAGGGVATLWLSSSARFAATACIFSDNMASGCRAQVSGGAIFAVGGNIELKETVMRQNFVEGGYNTRGGAISAQFARVDIHRVVFVGNEALGSSPGPSCSRSTLFVEGGAAYFMSTSVVTISSTRFEANRVGGASEGASGAAMSVGRLVSVDLRGSFFARNAAFRGGRTTSGGAVQISQEGKLDVTRTTFEENLVSGPSASSGGAIHADGSVVVLQAGVEFHGNVVEGELSSDGGALYVQSTGTVSSTGLPGPIFTNNTVRKWLVAPHKRSLHAVSA
jgi:hypothetical protein